MRDKLIIAALVLFFLLPSVSRAASFYMDGVCYGDTSALTEAWESKFPMVDQAANALDIIQFPTAITAAGVMTYRIDQQKISSGAITIGGVNSVQLMDCTGKNLIEVGKSDRTIMLFAVLLLFALGFQFGFRFFSNQVPGE